MTSTAAPDQGASVRCSEVHPSSGARCVELAGHRADHRVTGAGWPNRWAEPAPHAGTVGLDRAIANSDHWWMSCALMAIATLAKQGRPFDAYHLTELGVPDPDHSARWGSAFRVAHLSGAIEPVGYAPSRRPSVSGSIARVWRGVVRD